jgi:hypothetical protein
MTQSWAAEDLPAYMFVPREDRRPMTDEDAAMSAPSKIDEGTDEKGARAALAGRLRLSSTYRFISQAGESPMYLEAAAEILAGARAVQVHGRVYRVRDKEACRTRHWHGPCEICQPETWTVYPKKEKP